VELVSIQCPWCEEELALPPFADESQQTCPSCLTTWAYVTEEAELAEAA
jgi:hypothetical protein